MLVPFASCLADDCREALRGLQLPNLQRLLRRLSVEGTEAGAPGSLSMPHERVLARLQGLPTAEGLIPFAALQVQQERGGAGSQAWAWITPAHWRVGQDHIVMAHPQDLQLDGDDSRALLAAMQPYFAEDGITLEYDAPLRWLAHGEVFRALPSASLDRVIGRTLEGWLPSGEAGRPVRRLQQEMQMLLYTLPLNDARQRGGLLPVNSFWVSGTGALPPAYSAPAGSSVQLSPYLRDAALQGDWRAWSAAWQQLDAREGARLLGEVERGREVRITLCGEAGARTWSSVGASAWRRMAAWFGSASIPELLEGL